jgi:parallel beta-helix repeat protein
VFGLEIYSTKNVTIRNNKFFNGGGLKFSGIDYGLVENNSFLFSWAGIYNFNSSNNIFTNNTFVDNNYYGLNCDFYSKNNSFINNYLYNCSDGVVLRRNSTGNDISNNLISYSPINRHFRSRKISFQYETRGKIKIIKFHNPPKAGIRLLDNANYNKLLSNNVSYHFELGIVIHKSSFNDLSGNTIISNTEHGIYLHNAYYNEITGNNITWNGEVGICSIDSAYNKIYRNNIFSNTENAYSENPYDFWNFSYPTGGNFWGDYYGWDIRTGPNQSLNGSDGVGDVLYRIEKNSKDFYPLTEPLYGITFIKNKDKDNDGMDDDWEEKYELNSTWKNDMFLDPDSDQLMNIDEFLNNTNPNMRDSDRDGLWDGLEIKKYFTNPRNRDTDGDNYEDGFEIDKQTDPLDRSSHPIMSDQNNDFPSDDKVEGENVDDSEIPNYINLILITIIFLIIAIVIIISLIIKKKL